MSKFDPIHYTDYLQLNKLLDSQKLRSVEYDQPAHDEMLFIIVHQVYELWFRQILHELDSLVEIFSHDPVKESDIATSLHRLNRITEIQKLLIDEINVLETMTPLDFLEFRNLLIPASGFQSFQFRLIETKLGLRSEDRMTYNNKSYSSVFTDEQQKILEQAESNSSLFNLIENWLERMPFIDFNGYNFVDEYLKAVKISSEDMIDKINQANIADEASKNIRIRMIQETAKHIEQSLGEEYHNNLLKEGQIRLSYRASVSALMIYLYRDEPILRNPFNMLYKISEMDESFTTWRYRHAQMVMRMLGKKMGTGGSIGFEYLRATAEKHVIFRDLHNVSTLLISRSDHPILPDELKKAMDFNYSFEKKHII